MTDPAALAMASVTAGYGSTMVLRDVSFSVPRATVTAMLGANGAGKTTALRVAAGLIRPKAGHVKLSGVEVNRQPPHRRSRAGFCLIPEGRGIFPSLTVAENLRLQIPPRGRTCIDGAYDAFPILRARRHQIAGTMSGGEQQMLAIGRAMMASPKLLLLDEPSLGIAPVLVDRIYQTIGEIHSLGMAILLVEQNANRALEAASRGYVLETGRVVLADDTSSLQRDPKVQEAYLGT